MREFELRRTCSSRGKTDKFARTFNPKTLHEKDRLEILAIDNKILEIMIIKYCLIAAIGPVLGSYEHEDGPYNLVQCRKRLLGFSDI